MFEQWRGFKGTHWTDDVNVRDFIQNNYTSYDGDESFLAGSTEATDKLWGRLQELQKEERAKGGVLDMETEIVSGINAYPPAYIDDELKEMEKVVGLQTDKPLKRAFMPYGGIRMAQEACTTYGYTPNPKYNQIFNEYRKTHNQGVFDAYTPEMRLARKYKIITGLPDAYGRGRIVGDYRRVALYGIDFLIAAKKNDLLNCGCGTMTDDVIRQREELADQLRALEEMKQMALSYGYDISQPATNAREAVQWLYFGYLAAIKTQNGAAMSVGRISTFLDIYIERDLREGTLTEVEAQELIDHLVMKFRMVKFARIPSYNQLFSGDPVWATLEVGGVGMDGRHMVTKSDFRFLHTLENMGPAPEPNLTVLYTRALPEAFRRYSAKVSILTSSVQYENDDVMRPIWGDDYSICCCVPATSFDYSGAEINSDHIEELLQNYSFVSLSEMMNISGVLQKDAEVWRKLKLAEKYNIPIDGHAPGIIGEVLKQYVSAGISTDHESVSLSEALEKISLGMKILIREGSAAKNYEALKSLINSHPYSLMFCTDDSHPGDLIHCGHMIANI